MVSAKNASTVASRRKSPVAPTEHFRATVRRLDDILLATRGSDRRLKEAWPQLKGLHASLASGKTVTGAGEGRGLPMRIVIQTLKSAWHVDETWPIEAEDLKTKVATGPSNTAPEPGPPIRPDPDPQMIAGAYRRRGVQVDDAVKLEDDW